MTSLLEIDANIHANCARIVHISKICFSTTIQLGELVKQVIQVASDDEVFVCPSCIQIRDGILIYLVCGSILVVWETFTHEGNIGSDAQVWAHVEATTKVRRDARRESELIAVVIVVVAKAKWHAIVNWCNNARGCDAFCIVALETV